MPADYGLGHIQYRTSLVPRGHFGTRRRPVRYQTMYDINSDKAASDDTAKHCAAAGPTSTSIDRR